MNPQGTPHVVIIGAGFGGLYAARTLMKQAIDVTLVDRNNYHTFTPLLYQVATCALDASSIAYPVRSIFSKANNVRFLLGDVTDIQTQNRMISVNSGDLVHELAYDYLVIAAGSVTNHFGMENIANHSFGLKDLEDALKLRQHILSLFEQAAWSKDTAERDAMTTLVVVGGGATGLETAGALYELYNHVLKQEFGNITPRMRARVLLLEASGKLLAPYPEKLQQSAYKQLDDMGVEVLLNASVAEATPTQITLADGRKIATQTIIWAAGVSASPLAKKLDVPLSRQERVPVRPTMQLIEDDHVFVVGDLAYLEDSAGKSYPMVIPVAKQQGILAANNILKLIKEISLGEFKYYDRGIMATIGRSRAVAWIFYRVQLTGFLAWLSWLFLHLVVLLGFRNRLSVFLSWVWNYITYDRSVRLVMNPDKTDSPSHEETLVA